ncbi:MAG: aminoacyl-tRNA deacylase [Candidatus Tectomicrobia bacterium]|uniref:Cys-tRNA(Pro)/Cys-tRNA(Cys) deacylase n=1 Tax=Tectimicrobiota bacterium TaxID=2528274 RepID=A0A937W7A1_UNCTE|nr:aminoacyl-tRNA deacylase [Candidatus Tectomicrobia bacterium]
MAKKLNSMRLLEAQGIPYEVLAFPETIHSAQGVAEHCGLPPAQVYKTLVVVLAHGKPALVLVAADQEIHLKQLAQALGEKKLRMATQHEAEAWTGLQVGGISALALRHRPFPVYIDHAARTFPAIVVSAGQRGVDVRLAVADLVRVTQASFVEATASMA